MKKADYQLAVHNPGAVAWYSGLKFKMAVALTKALLTEPMCSAEVPGIDEAKATLTEELRNRLGVDDDYVSFEWSAGGMVHVHIAFWVVGAPRINKIEVPQEKEDEGKAYIEIDVVPEGVTVVPQSGEADRLEAC